MVLHPGQEGPQSLHGMGEGKDEILKEGPLEAGRLELATRNHGRPPRFAALDTPSRKESPDPGT